MDSHNQPVMCLKLIVIVIILETLQAVFSKFLTLTQNYFKKSFRYSGSVLWNSLPVDVRDACNFNNFKFMLKRYLMQS